MPDREDGVPVPAMPCRDLLGWHLRIVCQDCGRIATLIPGATHPDLPIYRVPTRLRCRGKRWDGARCGGRAALVELVQGRASTSQIHPGGARRIRLWPPAREVR